VTSYIATVAKPTIIEPWPLPRQHALTELAVQITVLPTYRIGCVTVMLRNLCFVANYNINRERKRRSVQSVRAYWSWIAFICTEKFFSLLDSCAWRWQCDDVWKHGLWRAMEIALSSNGGWWCSRRAKL